MTMTLAVYAFLGVQVAWLHWRVFRLGEELRSLKNGATYQQALRSLEDALAMVRGYREQVAQERARRLAVESELGGIS